MLKPWRMEDATKRAELEERQRRRDHFYGMALAGMLACPLTVTQRDAWGCAEDAMAAADRANAAEAGKGET